MFRALICPSSGVCDYVVELPPATTKRQHTSYQTHATKHHKFTLTLTPPTLQNETANVVVQQRSRKLLKMEI